MKFKRPIYRILFYTAWLVVMGGIVSLLIAANSKAKARTCKGVVVSINNGGDRIYVEKKDVLKTIEKTANGPLVNRHNGDINLASLEKNLEANPWIRDAELYFDTKDVLHVAVSERVPVARVFTTAGTSFYIDSAGYQMPLLESYTAKLPVVTGFMTAKHFTSADSALLQQVKTVVQAVSADAFWNAQVGEINLTPEGKFELIPVVGSHVIKLGSGTDAAEKLERLLVFYKQVLPKAGFAKYSTLDLQFDGQVVAVKRGPTSVIDSMQLEKNIEDLLVKKMAEQEPDMIAPQAVDTTETRSGDIEEPLAAIDTTGNKPIAATMKPVGPVKAGPANAATKGTPAVKASVQKTEVKKVGTTAKPVQKPPAKKPEAKPRAVMPKKVENEY